MDPFTQVMCATLISIAPIGTTQLECHVTAVSTVDSYGAAEAVLDVQQYPGMRRRQTLTVDHGYVHYTVSDVYLETGSAPAGYDDAPPRPADTPDAQMVHCSNRSWTFLPPGMTREQVCP